MLRLFLLTAVLLGSGFLPALAAPAVTATANGAFKASLVEFFAAQPEAHGAIAKLVAVQRWPKVQGAVRWSLPKLRYLPKRVSLIAERGQGKTLRRWYVAVSVKWMADVVTLKEDISARAVLVSSMLMKERKNIAGLRGEVWQDASDV
ncbi:MAG: flagella basal body P-ring formation protein FlgA, partial [Ghiorsea sp.]